MNKSASRCAINNTLGGAKGIMCRSVSVGNKEVLLEY
jgi:hypothetical protein